MAHLAGSLNFSIENYAHPAVRILLDVLHARRNTFLPSEAASTPSDGIFRQTSVRVAIEPPHTPLRGRGARGRSQTQKKGALTVACFKSVGCPGNRVLNVGAPVWALDFSPPVQDEQANTFTVLAIGSLPWSRPLTLAAANEVCRDVGYLQLWRVDADLNKAGVCAQGLCLQHQGGYCRSLMWAPHSKNDSSVGLLFAALGDKSVNCYSVPLEPFLNIAENITPVRLTPIWRVTKPSIFTCVCPASFYSIPTLGFVCRDGKNFPACLRVAAGSHDGQVFVWSLGSSTLADCVTGNLGQESPVVRLTVATDKATITAIAWAPIPSQAIFAVSTARGTVTLWDIRRPCQGCLHSLDIVKRATYSLRWSSDSRFLYVCHVSPIAFNIMTGECFNRSCTTTESVTDPTLKALQNERPPWSCAELESLAFYACDDGKLFIMAPALYQKRNFAKTSRVIRWLLAPPESEECVESSEGNQNKVELDTAASLLETVVAPSIPRFQPVSGDVGDTASNLPPVPHLQEFWQDSARYAAWSFMTARSRIIHLTMESSLSSVYTKAAKTKEYRCENTLSRPASGIEPVPAPDPASAPPATAELFPSTNKPQRDIAAPKHPVLPDFEALAASVRLTAVASLSPSFYTIIASSPLVAVGSSAGVVHIFNPHAWQLLA